MANKTGYGGTNKSSTWILISGIFFLLLGMYIFKKPINALINVAYYIAIVKIIAGCGGVFLYLRNKNGNSDKFHFITSIIDLIFGIALISSPFLKLYLIAVMPIIIGVWAMIRGAIMCYSSFANKGAFSNWLSNAFVGIVTLIAGFIIVSNPFGTAFLLTQTFGAFFIFIGVCNVVHFIAIKLRK